MVVHGVQGFSVLSVWLRPQNIIQRTPQGHFSFPSCPCDFEHNEYWTSSPSEPLLFLCASSQWWTIMLIQKLPLSLACYTVQYSTFTAIVNNTMRCFYSANALFFIIDLLGHHDIPSFHLPPPCCSPISLYAGGEQLCHMCNKCASLYFVHACTPGCMLYVTAVNMLSIHFC